MPWGNAVTFRVVREILAGEEITTFAIYSRDYLMNCVDITVEITLGKVIATVDV
jgi:hypothetical protein